MHQMSRKANYANFSQFSFCHIALEPIKEAEANLKGCRKKEGHSMGVLRRKAISDIA